MVVSMEPMIMPPEGLAGAGGYREHDIPVVTEDGVRNITGFTCGPEKNIVGQAAVFSCNPWIPVILYFTRLQSHVPVRTGQ